MAREVSHRPIQLSPIVTVFTVMAGNSSCGFAAIACVSGLVFEVSSLGMPCSQLSSWIRFLEILVVA